MNQRIVPHADVPQKDPRVRLQPRPKDGLPSWADKVADGWHALSLEGWRAVIFAVRTAGRLAAFAPALTVMRCGFHCACIVFVIVYSAMQTALMVFSRCMQRC